jgi:hypothetical protein
MWLRLNHEPLDHLGFTNCALSCSWARIDPYLAIVDCDVMESDSKCQVREQRFSRDEAEFDRVPRASYHLLIQTDDKLHWIRRKHRGANAATTERSPAMRAKIPSRKPPTVGSAIDADLSTLHVQNLEFADREVIDAANHDAARRRLFRRRRYHRKVSCAFVL